VQPEIRGGHPALSGHGACAERGHPETMGAAARGGPVPEGASVSAEPPAPTGAPGSGWTPQAPPPPAPAPPPGWPQQHPPGDWSAPGWSPPRRNGPGIASFFLGLLALPAVLFVVPGVLIGALAVALGLIGLGRVKRHEADASGVATTGLILGIVAVVLGIVWGVFTTIGANRAQEDYDACRRAGIDKAQCVDEFDPADP